jgi:hypothetical protein
VAAWCEVAEIVKLRMNKEHKEIIIALFSPWEKGRGEKKRKEEKN